MGEEGFSSMSIFLFKSSRTSDSDSSNGFQAGGASQGFNTVIAGPGNGAGESRSRELSPECSFGETLPLTGLSSGLFQDLFFARELEALEAGLECKSCGTLSRPRIFAGTGCHNSDEGGVTGAGSPARGSAVRTFSSREGPPSGGVEEEPGKAQPFLNLGHSPIG